MHQHNPHEAHGHCPHSSPPNVSNFAFIIAILLNFIYTIFQVIFALIANSSSLLADAGHNLSDVLSLLFAWLGNIMSKKKSTTRFTYGYKRTSILTALINALILFIASGAIAFEAIDKFIHPAPVEAIDVIVVAAIGILVNLLSALFFMKGKKDLNIKAAFLHLMFDALVSLGVVIGGIIMFFTHWYWLDPVISLVITVVIIIGTWNLLKESLFMALDAVPTHIESNIVKAFLENQTDIHSVHDLHIWNLSTTVVALSAHLYMPADCQDDRLAAISTLLENEFGISHTTLQIEKKPTRDGHCPAGDHCN